SPHAQWHGTPETGAHLNIEGLTSQWHPNLAGERSQLEGVLNARSTVSNGPAARLSVRTRIGPVALLRVCARHPRDGPGARPGRLAAVRSQNPPPHKSRHAQGEPAIG